MSDTLHLSPYIQTGMRLGNVMFVLAAAYAHALRVGVPCHVPWNFNSATRALRSFLGEDTLPSTLSGVNEPETYRERCFSYSPIPGNIKHGGLCGYFQSAKYFDDQEEHVRNLFAPLTAPRQENTLGVHIRLGDYKRLRHKHRLADADFLQRAFSRISQEIGRLVLFSDEPDAALSLLKEIPGAERFAIEVDNGSPCEALRLMSSMQELIMSCSSFSWWAACLGKMEKVIVPRNWFVGEIRDYQDVCLSHWIQL